MSDDPVVEIAIIGGGAAGLMAGAVLAATHPRPDRVALYTDGALGRGNSVMAQGGLHVPFDDVEPMLEDMRRSAGPSFDEGIARRYVDEIAETVMLLESWGLELERTSDGELVRRSAGASSEPRIVRTTGPLGPSLIRILRSRVGPVQVHTNTRIDDMRLVARTPSEGSAFELVHVGGSVRAAAVIVATGGTGWAEARVADRRTTNQSNENGHLRPALEAVGLRYVGDERWQRHPFGLVELEAGDPGKALPETVIGTGVELTDVDGRRIVDIAAGRRALSRAIDETIARGRGVTAPNGQTGVRLSVTAATRELLETGHPQLWRRLTAAGLATASEVLVAPFLHYELGGYEFGPGATTTVPGLFIAGEVTGGLHGDNRLMGNGIADSLVHGRLAALGAIDHLAAREPAGG